MSEEYILLLITICWPLSIERECKLEREREKVWRESQSCAHFITHSTQLEQHLGLFNTSKANRLDFPKTRGKWRTEGRGRSRSRRGSRLGKHAVRLGNEWPIKMQNFHSFPLSLTVSLSLLAQQCMRVQQSFSGRRSLQTAQEDTAGSHDNRPLHAAHVLLFSLLNCIEKGEGEGEGGKNERVTSVYVA